MTSLDVSITLHLITIKNGDKSIFVIAFCFVFTKSAADAHRIICEMYYENLIAIKI